MSFRESINSSSISSTLGLIKSGCLPLDPDLDIVHDVSGIWHQQEFTAKQRTKLLWAETKGNSGGTCCRTKSGEQV